MNVKSILLSWCLVFWSASSSLGDPVPNAEKFTSADIAGKVYENENNECRMRFTATTLDIEPLKKYDFPTKSYAWKLVDGVLMLSAPKMSDKVSFTLYQRKQGALITQIQFEQGANSAASWLETWKLVEPH